MYLRILRGYRLGLLVWFVGMVSIPELLLGYVYVMSLQGYVFITGLYTCEYYRGIVRVC